jgi:hypothetical protein
MDTLSTSTRSAAIACWIVDAPPLRRTSLPSAAAKACSTADSMPSVTK